MAKSPKRGGPEGPERVEPALRRGEDLDGVEDAEVAPEEEVDEDGDQVAGLDPDILEELLEVGVGGKEEENLDDVTLFAKRVRGDLKENPIHDSEGRPLGNIEIQKRFVTFLRGENFPPPVIYKLYNDNIYPYLKEIGPLIGKLKDTNLGPVAKSELRADITRKQTVLGDIVREVLLHPERYIYRFDAKDFDKDRDDLMMSATELSSRLDDVEPNVDGLVSKETFEIFRLSGREMTLENIGKSVFELLKKSFPDREDKWLVSIYENLIEYYFDKIRLARPFHDDPGEVKKKKRNERTEAEAYIALFMRDICKDGKIDAYLHLMVEGETLEDDLVPFPLFEERLPLGFVKKVLEKITAQNSGARNRAIRDFFARRIEKRGGVKYLAPLREKYLEGDTSVLYDNCGRKWATLYTEEINALLKDAGFSATEIDNAYGAEIGRHINARFVLEREIEKDEENEKKALKDKTKTDQELRAIRKLIQNKINELPALDKEIVESVRMRLGMPDVYKFSDVGKGRGFMLEARDLSQE